MSALPAVQPTARPGIQQLLMLGVDLVGPIAVYYGLTGARVGNRSALVAAAVLPATTAGVKILRERKLDQLALIVVASMLASVAISYLTGSTRFLLAKDGFITGVWGLWFLVSARSHRPAALLFTRPLLEGRRAFAVTSWDTLWDDSPAFRRIWRTSTVVWGLGLGTDAAIRVVMAYALPVHMVPALGGALYPVTFVVLQVVTNVYYHRSGLWTILGARWSQPVSTQA